MTLPIPFPIYGQTKDSNEDILPNLPVKISGTSEVTVTSDSNGKYLHNIQNIATEGQDLHVRASYLGEHADITWNVSLVPPSKRIDVILQETITTGEKCLNAYHTVGNQAYVFTSKDTESYLKISDFNWEV